MSTLASNAYHAIALTHIAAGTLALVTYWTAALSRKTRYSLHVRAGNLYLWAMRAILVTAVPMAGFAFLKGQTAVGIFLSYLVVLVATTVYTAPKAVQCKQDFERFRGGAFRALAISLPAVAAATFVYGVVVSNLLLGGFSIVGLVVGWQMWVTRLHRRRAGGSRNTMARCLATASARTSPSWPSAWGACCRQSSRKSRN
jgi:hypothetical protein